MENSSGGMEMSAQLWKMLGFYLICVNLGAFAAMWADKRRAQRGRWRISEKALFLFPVLGGALGGLLGMRVFHHKTKHWYFRCGFFALLVVWIMIALALRAWNFK